MLPCYTVWIYHGEIFEDSQADASNVNTTRGNEFYDADEEYDELPEMLGEMYTALNPQGGGSTNDTQAGMHTYDRLMQEAEREVYPGCKKFSLLNFISRLLHLKVLNRWSIKSFNMLLGLLKDVLPEGENLPRTYYEANKLLKGLGLGYVNIHACVNDCTLFWKATEGADVCHVCGTSRWKFDQANGKKIPLKILRYFPLAPRLQRLFLSKKTATEMRWHKERKMGHPDLMAHPADSPAWHDFDSQFPDFAHEPRNVRLGLATDGFNPFGDKNNPYSIWPVILVPYNLPPWMCMKEPFFMLTLLIPGPKQPGVDMDVYLQPLVDELNSLWNDGIRTYDTSKSEFFQMKETLMWTINDFPAYANISGWSTKGYLACPCCNKDASSIRLRDKIGYMGHRRFLPDGHSWRKNKKDFNGQQEWRGKPTQLTPSGILGQLEMLQPRVPGKCSSTSRRRRGSNELNWKKKSIFFDLPYWAFLNPRHNLDVMHIVKNVCDNLVGTFLNVEGKTKDTLKARQDLQDMGIRSELHLQRHDESYIKPPSCYTLTPHDRKRFCEFLMSIKYPDGYAANLSRCVNARDGKINGLKTHDCYILLQHILPIGMRGYLRNDICTVLFELANFFKQLCSRCVSKRTLDACETDIVLILCKLEKIFPPAFFDVMINLCVHLPMEAKRAGPVQYR